MTASAPLFGLWIWPEGVSARVFRWLIVVKSPAARAYFSERNGYRVPVMKARGWRLFISPPTPADGPLEAAKGRHGRPKSIPKGEQG